MGTKPQPAETPELQPAAKPRFETKAFEMKLDELRDDGSFEGYAAVFGNVDLEGDIIDPGAFKKTIRESKGVVPILWHHDRYEPIGVSTELSEDDKGLHAVGQLVLDTQRGREVHALMKARAVTGLSIGYSAVKFLMERDSSPSEWSFIRRLKELKLREFSPVTFPANPLAVVASVKTEDLVRLERALRELGARDPEAVKALLEAIEPATATRAAGAAMEADESAQVEATLRALITNVKNGG